jgi:beta-glucosidase
MFNIIKCRFICLPVILCFSLISTAQQIYFKEKAIQQRVDSVMKLMTLQEKIGQLNQLSSAETTGPELVKSNNMEYVRKGLCGSMLNVIGAAITRQAQQIAVNETRLHIPLLFGYDVIHGFKTIFPIPLAEAASWDMGLMEKSARVAAIEASAAGLHWTFAPMVDIARDARWGRIMEGAGEDVYLASLIAAARVKGFQENLKDNTNILACAKHYAAYGAAIGGRDYNSTDISERTLQETYLPPFRAAADAGVATFMSAFNEINGVPASGNEYLLRNILKQDWGFNGFVVSDWGSVGELVNHGVAKNKNEAAMIAINAGVDMEMVSLTYVDALGKLVKEGLVKEQIIDDACSRILYMKFKLGLFDDPYKYCSTEREQANIFTPEHRKAALEMAQKSVVLLKNNKGILPLNKNSKTIAVIGPLADAQPEMIGQWPGKGEEKDAVTLLQGLKNKLPSSAKIIYTKGCNINDDSTKYFNAAIKNAAAADVVLLALGEGKMMSGENTSRADIGLPGVQLDLAKAVIKTGKPVIVVLTNGRALAIKYLNDNATAIVEGWILGTEAGNALAEVLVGNVNPSGKLPVSFPYATGQVPVYYNYKSTGRPYMPNQQWVTKYIDIPNEALFPFGFGLSYTSFSYSNITLSDNVLTMNGEITASIQIKNTGTKEGEEIVQLYVQDMVAQTARPVKELKDFKKINLQPGETKQVNFIIKPAMLKYYDIKMNLIAEPGDFKLSIGTNSREVKEAMFTLKE